MAEAATTEGGTPPPAPPPAAPQTPWYQGKLEPDFIGHAQNKGWKLDDPATLAVEAIKAHREAEKFVGVPADQLLRLPKDAKDEAGWNTVWTRLGQPKEMKDYDLSSVKFADGTAIEEAFADTIRQTAFSNHVPKDAATAFAQSFVKFMENADKSELEAKTADLAKEKDALAKSWGPNAELNKLTAMQGAKRLGVSPEDVQLLENQLGYSRVMEMFRKIGAGTSEDTFIEGKTSHTTTLESAQARLQELQNDTAWAQRLLRGDSVARREFDALTQQIAAAA